MLKLLNYVSVQHAPSSGYKCKYVKTYDLKNNNNNNNKGNFIFIILYGFLQLSISLMKGNLQLATWIDYKETGEKELLDLNLKI